MTWPWELCELLNLAAALERASEFDVIHYQAMSWPVSLPLTRLVSVPLVQTVHHAPGPLELSLWTRYPEALFVAISHAQASMLEGLNVIATIHHGVDTDAFAFSGTPRDYLLYLGRFTEGKGVLQAIEVARRTSRRLILAAPENDYYQTTVAPHVDGTHIIWAGEVGHECTRDRPRRTRSPADDDQHQAGHRPARCGKERVGVRDRGERAHVVRQPVTRRDAEVVRLDGDERDPQHQRSAEQ